MEMERILLISMLVKVVPLLLAGGIGWLVFSRSGIGKSIIRNLQSGGADAEVLASLQADVEDLRRELGEVHERLDFAERRLLQQRQPLPPVRSDAPSPPEPVSAV
jgi:hypothetical protein